jgi:excinuclease ABC subunit C
LRRRRITESVLDEIPGIGPRRRLELMKAFGSVAKIRQAAPAVIVEKVPGIGPDLAAAVVEYLARH